MTRTRSTRSSTTASSLVHSPANLATPAPSPTSPTLMSTPASASASASPATEPANPAATASKPVRRTQIAKIGDERLRRSALLKRRHGLYKKATELATLCDCQVAILIFDSNDRLHHYSTTDNVDDILLRYASHYRPALDVRTAREYGGGPELGTRPSTGANFMGGNMDAPNPSTFVNPEGHVSNLLGFNPSDPTPVDADAMMYNLVDDDDGDDDLAMVTSPIFTPAVAPSDPFGQHQQQQQMILSESGASFIQPSPVAQLNRQLSTGHSSTRRSAGIPIPTPLQIPMGHSPLGCGTIAMSPMSLPTQSPFFSAFDMMAINSPRMPASATTPTDPTAGSASSLSRVPSTKKRRIDAVMHSDSAYVPNSPMFTPSLLASHPLPPLPPSVRGYPGNGGMSIDGTGSFASTSTSWLGSGGTIGGPAAASPFQLPFTQTPTDMAADLMYSMPPSGTMPALPGTGNNPATQFMSPMTIATGTPMQAPMMTPLTMPSDTFMPSAAAQPPLSAGPYMPPPASAAATPGFGTAATQPAAPATSGPLRLPPTRSLSAVFPDISLSEYLHAHPPHPATGESGEALMGTLAWDAHADVAPPTGPSVDQVSAAAKAPEVSAAAVVAAHAMAGQQFHPERVMSLDTILNAFTNTTSAAAPAAPAVAGAHQLQQATSIFDFESGAGGRCVSPGDMVDDPQEVDEDVNLAPAGEGTEGDEERRTKNVMAWPLLG